MIGEDIVDFREGIDPGPRGDRGPEGPRGLPGVNAVAADEAVAAYIGASDSATAGALASWRGLVDVRRYGARGDGVTDDAGAFQDALDAVGNAGVAGVFVPAGEWLVRSTLLVGSNTRVVGLGSRSRIVFDSTRADWDFAFSVNQGASNIMFEDLGFRGVYRNDPRYLVRAAGNLYDGIMIRRIRVDDGNLCVIGDYQGDTSVHGRNVEVTGCSSRLWHETGEGGVTHGNTRAFIEINNTDGVLVEDNVLANASYEAAGIQFWGGRQDPADYAGGGSWCRDITIRGNTVTGCYWSPIWWSHAEHVIMSGNTMSDCGDVCLSIESCRNSVISGNTLSESNNALVSFANALDNVVFADNVCTQSGQPGRASSSASTPRQRSRIFIRWGARNAERSEASQGLTISGNQIRFTGAVEDMGDVGYGMMQLGSNTGDLVFEGNRVSNCVLWMAAAWPADGQWGVAGNADPTRVQGSYLVRGNVFAWDDAAARLALDAQTAAGLRLVTLSPPAGGVGVFSGNVVESSVRTPGSALDSSPAAIGLWWHYGSLQDTISNTVKGMMIITGNTVKRVSCPVRLIASTPDSAVSHNAILEGNTFIGADRDAIRLSLAGGASVTVHGNLQDTLSQDTLTWMQPWPNSSDEISLESYRAWMAVGSDLTPRGGVTINNQPYRGLTLKSDGWHPWGTMGDTITTTTTKETTMTNEKTIGGGGS